MKFSIRTLLFMIALSAMITGWVMDHISLNSTIEKLNSIGDTSESRASIIAIGGFLRGPQTEESEQQTYPLWSEVTSEQLVGCPIWRVAAEDPPVSASAAIALADQAVTTLVLPGPDGSWQREEIALMHLDGHHWCWRAEYESKEESLQTGGFNIFVLMDRSVLKPDVGQLRPPPEPRWAPPFGS